MRRLIGGPRSSLWAAQGLRAAQVLRAERVLRPAPVLRVLWVLLAGAVVFWGSPVFAAGAPEIPAGPDLLTIALVDEPESLDPVWPGTPSADSVRTHLMEGLVSLEETLPGEGVSPVPALAESWERNDDATIWTFEIRRGVVFHDGTSLDARAVLVNLERFRDSPFAPARAALLEPIESIEQAGSHTIRIVLSRPCADIPFRLARAAPGIVSPAWLRDISPEDPSAVPAGTGPYVVDRWARGEEISLTVNRRYWGPPPGVSRLVFTVLPQASARVAALERGEVDVALEIPPGRERETVGKAGLSLIRRTSPHTTYIGFHTTRGPLKDPLVRRALNHAVQGERILEGPLQGAATRARGPLAPVVFGSAPADPYGYDPALARELLSRAGFPEGFEMVLYHPLGQHPREVAVARAVQDMLLQVGVRVRLESYSLPRFLELTSLPADRAGYDAYLMGWETATLDADWGLFPQFHSEALPPAGNNRGFYANALVDDLLLRGRQEPDRQTRQEIYAEVLRKIGEDAPGIFLYHQEETLALSRGWRGVSLHPLGYLRTGQAPYGE